MHAKAKIASCLVTVDIMLAMNLLRTQLKQHLYDSRRKEAYKEDEGRVEAFLTPVVSGLLDSPSPYSLLPWLCP